MNALLLRAGRRLALLVLMAVMPMFAQAADWPASGEIVYQITMGDGPQIGEARHSWSHDGRQYRMQTAVRTVGLAALIKNLHYVQRSEGEVTAKGLRPARFSVEREGKLAELAEFDWQRKLVSHTRKGRTRESALLANDQDVLSLWHQVSIGNGRPLPGTLNVVTGRKAADSTLAWVGDETVELPMGRIKARRLKARAVDGSMEIEVWFAAEQHMLPVRIRMTDDDGEVLDQRASELRIGAATNGKGS